MPWTALRPRLEAGLWAAATTPVDAAGAAAALTAGRYTLTFALDRPRWRSSGAADPESRYHQERAADLAW